MTKIDEMATAYVNAVFGITDGEMGSGDEHWDGLFMAYTSCAIAVLEYARDVQGTCFETPKPGGVAVVELEALEVLFKEEEKQS